VDPDMSWTSSLATPPTLSSTVLIGNSDKRVLDKKSQRRLLSCHLQSYVRKKMWKGWRDCSVVRALAALRVSWFSSQHPCGGSQLSIAPVPGELVSSSSLYRLLHACDVHTYL
jgi:hypothetical protein